MARPPRRRFKGRPVKGLGVNARQFKLKKPYLRFHWMLAQLDHYFDNWLLPREFEEAAMTRVILAMQNILDYETELVIAGIASQSNAARRDRELQNRIEKGWASFKEKFTRLLQKGLISKADYEVMDAIRLIRNAHAHWRPSATRRKLTYFGRPLLTRKAVQQILTDPSAKLLC